MSPEHDVNKPAAQSTNAELPAVVTSLDPAAISQSLDQAARRGKLPGFAAAKPGSDSLYSLSDFGTPFESIMHAAASRAESQESPVTRLRFSIRLKPTMPWVFVIVLLTTVWPGVWLTASLLNTYSDWYSSLPWWVTYAWYLPLTVPFIPPAIISALRRSRSSGRTEALELITKVAGLLGGRVE